MTKNKTTINEHEDDDEKVILQINGRKPNIEKIITEKKYYKDIHEFKEDVPSYYFNIPDMELILKHYIVPRYGYLYSIIDWDERIYTYIDESENGMTKIYTGIISLTTHKTREQRVHMWRWGGVDD